MTLTPEILPAGGELATTSGAAGELTVADQRQAAEALAELISQGMAPNTRAAYQSDVRYFGAWYAAHYGREFPGFPLIEEVLVTFIHAHLVEGLTEEVAGELEEAGVLRRKGTGPVRHKPSTVSRRLAALGRLHDLACPSVPNPRKAAMVREALKGATKIAARNGATVRKADAATRPILEDLLAATSDDLRGIRDRALLLVGWASGGRRRSELAALQVDDIQRIEDPDGDDLPAYVLRIRFSKTDQSGEGREFPVLGRAALALEEWLQASGLVEGPLFRSINRWGHVRGSLQPASVNDIIKGLGARAGLDTSKLSAHSLRAGFATQSGIDGVVAAEAMALTGHKTAEVFAGYRRAGDLLRSKAARMAG